MMLPGWYPTATSYGTEEGVLPGGSYHDGSDWIDGAHIIAYRDEVYPTEEQAAGAAFNFDYEESTEGWIPQ